MPADAAFECRTAADLAAMPEDYRIAVQKIVASHARNELYGAQVFDEPAIVLAPTPYAKWLTCRVAMEEYHHHVRFKALGEEIGIPQEKMDPKTAAPLSIFGFPLRTWAEFCVIKLLADLAEILQVEDLLHCSFHPLRDLARVTMPEEKFHAQFGRDFCAELVRTDEGRRAVQDAIDRYFPLLPGFFGASDSKNNRLYRECLLKQRTNDEMRADYLARAKDLVESVLGLQLPEVAAQAA